ncbi:MAG: hypothetical protein PUB10_07695, partial [Clostridiales bacterium]|nr:hypothetical protein [Clostridiales bacterium]
IMNYPFEHVGTWFCVFCKTLVPLRVQRSESGYFMIPDILHAFSGCALVTAELLLIVWLLRIGRWIWHWGNAVPETILIFLGLFKKTLIKDIHFLPHPDFI